MRDSLGDVQSVLVLGGASEIGLAIAAELSAPRRATVVLAGRHPAALASAAAGLESRTGRVQTIAFDATLTETHDDVMAHAVAAAGGDIDVVVVAFGVLGEEDPEVPDRGGAVTVAETNYVGSVSAGLAAARLLTRQGHGTIVALSSVAGERVRRDNFVYGSSKAGMDGFFQGLSDRLYRSGSGVRVLVVRPGFVRTRMTARQARRPMSTTASEVADATGRGLARRKHTVWVPAGLRPVFAVFRHLPRWAWRYLPV